MLNTWKPIAFLCFSAFVVEFELMPGNVHLGQSVRMACKWTFNTNYKELVYYKITSSESMEAVWIFKGDGNMSLYNEAETGFDMKFEAQKSNLIAEHNILLKNAIESDDARYTCAVNIAGNSYKPFYDSRLTVYGKH